MNTVDWWLRDRTADGSAREGRRVIWQAPNAAVWVFLGAQAARLGPWERDADLILLGRGALMVWGLDEVLRGVNPFRRLVGAAVLGWQVTSFVIP